MEEEWKCLKITGEGRTYESYYRDYCREVATVDVEIQSNVCKSKQEDRDSNS